MCYSYAASFFSPVRLVGIVGKDWPDSYSQLLSECGIDSTGSIDSLIRVASKAVVRKLFGRLGGQPLPSSSCILRIWKFLCDGFQLFL